MTGMLDTASAPSSAAERDLQTAGQLQRMLLPPSAFTANGWTAVHTYQPAGVVSGDYLDLVPYGDRLYFMVGDVSGNGFRRRCSWRSCMRCSAP